MKFQTALTNSTYASTNYTTFFMPFNEVITPGHGVRENFVVNEFIDNVTTNLSCN